MFNLNIEDVLSKTNSKKNGITSKEAEERLSANGRNKLDEAKKKSWLMKFFAQFKDILIIVLIISCGISVTFAILEHSPGELIDAAIILLIVIVNAVIGLVQESKAEKSMESLRNLTKPFAKVMRDGKITRVKTEELVVGDVVVIEAGDIVPADLRLIESASLQIQESALTGESVPSEKDITELTGENIPLGDRKNIAFMSGVVTYGRGKGIVIAVGMQTEMGKIAHQLNKQEKTITPLTKRINKTNKIITLIVLLISIFIFITDYTNGVPFTESFMVAVAIAVCAIPEGLPASITITMALGVQRMSLKKAIVRNLPAVETLGSTEVICSDKTGTLTLNKMTVQTIFTIDETNKQIKNNIYNHQDEKDSNYKKDINFEVIKQSTNFMSLVKCMLLCNDTQTKFEGSELITVGDPTETALVHYGYTFQLSKDYYDGKFERVNEVPFDSDRKLMTTINKEEEKTFAYCKGAVDSLLGRCTKILDGGKVRKITNKDIEDVKKANSKFATHALRVLAYAYKPFETTRKKVNSENVENDFIFIGLTGMIDPPREEVAESIKVCKAAGIMPVMITGDHKDTAFAIAKQLGIAVKDSEVVTGAELSLMTDEELDSKIMNIKVYARVNPEHKVRIVKAFKAKNKVVAMTGDGVNDAPSIKAADIGIGMGITGTDVTKGVSDIILTDDNFATIVGAVEEGRRVYSNIIKIIIFLLGTSVAEVILLTTIIAFFKQPFFGPALILWINFVSDTLPALALGSERAESDVMLRSPNNSRGNLFKGKVGIDILWYSFIQAVLTFSVYFLSLYGLHLNTTTTITMCFVTLVICELFHSYNLRSDINSIFKGNMFSNKWLNGAFIISLLLTTMIVVFPITPLQNAFGITVLNITQWLISFGFAFLIIPIVEISKLVVRKYRKNKKKSI